MRPQITFDLTLHDDHVGFLKGPEPWTMEFDEAWVNSYPRAVLGQWFEDKDLRQARQASQLFSYFRNLLPERSALRSLIAHSGGFDTDDDAALLRHVGIDLPGALLVTVGVDRPEPRDTVDESLEIGTPYRFALAGVQPKMSVRLSDDYRALVPVAGDDGHWILKLPAREFPGLPEAEHATMSWARDAGFEVPETRLIDRGNVEGLPDRLLAEPGPLYMCRRYDRTDGGERLHQEDFAQVIGRHPEDKYDCDAARFAAVVKRIVSPEEYATFLGRLVFDCFVGNGDAHLKNWSLLYRDEEGRRATLAPCYDIVPTIFYLDRQGPALKMPGAKYFRQVDRGSMTKLLKQTGSNQSVIWEGLSRIAERIADAWSGPGARLFTGEQRDTIQRHFESVPLIRNLLGLRGDS